MGIKSGEDVMDRRLRWMRENIDGAYHATHPPGHENEGMHCTNSGTCIIVCCYMHDFLVQSNARG